MISEWINLTFCFRLANARKSPPTSDGHIGKIICKKKLTSALCDWLMRIAITGCTWICWVMTGTVTFMRKLKIVGKKWWARSGTRCWTMVGSIKYICKDLRKPIQPRHTGWITWPLRIQITTWLNISITQTKRPNFTQSPLSMITQPRSKSRNFQKSLSIYRSGRLSLWKYLASAWTSPKATIFETPWKRSNISSN